MFDILLTLYQFVEGLGTWLYTIAGLLPDVLKIFEVARSIYDAIKNTINFPQPFSSLMSLTLGLGIVKFLWKG